MDAARKSFEMQAQVRHNAETFKSTLNDLLNWEKEIKDKEQELQRSAPVEEHLKSIPVRSHVEHATSPTTNGEKEVKGKKGQVNSRMEKDEATLDPHGEKRKRANELKDHGNKHVKLGEYHLGIDKYTEAIDIFPMDPVFYSNRALCYLRLEKYDDCIEDCERAIQIDQQSVKAYYRRMQANEALGNNMDALKDCTTVLMIEPKNAEAKRSLERINERLKKDNKTTNGGPNFTAARPNLVDILPIDKPAYKRSNKPLRRVPIADVVVSRDNKNHENSNLKISDEEIDKLFNSNCGPFVEVKKKATEAAKKKEEQRTTGAPKNIPELSTLKSTPKDTTSKLIKDPKEAEIAQLAPPAKPTIDSNKALTTQEESKTLASKKNSQILPISNHPLPPAPTTTAQFYLHWKELVPQQKYQFLKSIEIRKLCKILGASFDSEILTDIIYILRDFYLPNKEPSIAETLAEVSKNNEVAILSLFMTTDDRKVLSEILNAIKEQTPNSSMLQLIEKNFNLK